MWLPYPAWLSPGDNAWQMTAATLVGLMSVPGLVVLYGGVMQKRWSINSMMLTFAAFAVVLDRVGAVGLQDGLRDPVARHLAARVSSGTSSVKPATILSHSAEQGQATIPLATTGPSFRFPQATLAYFQFVFAAITPILMLGSVLGRINFKAWIPFVALWSSIVYTVDAFVHLGRRFLRPARRGRLLRWLRDPPLGRCVGLRRGGGDRPETPARPRDRRAQQRGDGRGRGRIAVARLERLQRRRPVLRGRVCVGGGSEHEPLYGGRVPGLGRVGLHDRSQAGADLGRQRDDRRSGGDHAGGRFRQRLGRDRDRASSPRRSSTSRSTT